MNLSAEPSLPELMEFSSRVVKRLCWQFRRRSSDAGYGMGNYGDEAEARSAANECIATLPPCPPDYNMSAFVTLRIRRAVMNAWAASHRRVSRTVDLADVEDASLPARFDTRILFMGAAEIVGYEALAELVGAEDIYTPNGMRVRVSQRRLGRATPAQARAATLAAVKAAWVECSAPLGPQCSSAEHTAECGYKARHGNGGWSKQDGRTTRHRSIRAAQVQAVGLRGSEMCVGYAASGVESWPRLTIPALQPLAPLTARAATDRCTTASLTRSKPLSRSSCWAVGGETCSEPHAEVSLQTGTLRVSHAGFDELSDIEWSRIEPIVRLPQRAPRPSDLRALVNGIRWVLQFGVGWYRMPSVYGASATAQQAHARWRASGVWQRVKGVLSVIELPRPSAGDDLLESALRTVAPRRNARAA